MNAEIYYREELDAPLVGKIILLSIIGLISFLFLYQMGTGDMIGSNPAPNIVLFIIDVLLIGTYFTFSKMEISLTPEGLLVRYNWIKEHLDYSEIINVEEKTAELFQVGGIGLKYTTNGEKAYTTRLGKAIRINIRDRQPLLITPSDTQKVFDALNCYIS